MKLNIKRTTTRPNIAGQRHVVSAGHYLSAQAGFLILEAGGNAVDAGVAAGLVSNVVEPHMCGFAGVAPMMFYDAGKRSVSTIDGLGTWPRRATAAMFREAGHEVIPEGILQTVVPGAPAAWMAVLARHGTMTFGEVASAAIRFAEEGFTVHPEMANRMSEVATNYPSGTESASIMTPGGKLPQPGDTFVQKDLARTLRYLVDCERAAGGDRARGLQAASDAFYRGDIARAIAKFHRESGGLLDETDLAEYRPTFDAPQKIDFHGTTVYSCGPWCQGPMMLQTLNTLRGIDLKGLGHNSPDYLHVLIEAIKLAAADREAYYSDPKFSDVPMARLLSPEYGALRARQIDMGRAFHGLPAPGLGVPDGMVWPTRPDDIPEQSICYDTTYLCVIDRDGNAFSVTPSDPIMRISPTVPGTGLFVSSRGIQSRVEEAHPAAVRGGKRPRLTPNPALAIRDGEFVMPFGTPGGDLQTQAMAQFMLNVSVFGMTPQEAIEAPRAYSKSFPDSFSPNTFDPGKLQLEWNFSAETAADLAGRGHTVAQWKPTEWTLAGVCAVMHDLPTDTKVGGADPRRTCYALGW